MMWWYGGWWWIFGMVVFWGVIIALVVWAVKKFTERRGPEMGAARSPLEIAKERYARGEITREQFEQLKKDLQ